MIRLLQRFAKDTSAAVAFETVIVFPFFIWAWIGTFAFFDAYRVYNTSIKATFTVADLIARERDEISCFEIEGMGRMLAAMIRDTDGIEMRVTQILRSNAGEYIVDWSHPTGNLAQLFTASLAAIEHRLPDMANGEKVILVESFVDYEPAFNMGLNDLSFENFTLTRPRGNGQKRYDPTCTAPAVS